jgi:hypothetical protein
MANGFRIVFMTQQTTWNSVVDPTAKAHHWMRYRAGASDPRHPGSTTGATFREDLMDAAMERLNDTMRDVCTRDSIPLYDLARTLPKSLQYFYDDCHFNVAGAAGAGKGIAQFMVAHRLVPSAGRDVKTSAGAITEMPRE